MTNLYSLHDTVSCRWTGLRYPTVDEIASIQSEARCFESDPTLTLYRNGIPIAIFGDEPLSPAEAMAAHLAEFGR